jgi:hypothetical protein
MTLYLTDSQKDLTIKAILSEINYHQQKINSWVELYRKLQSEQTDVNPPVGRPDPTCPHCKGSGGVPTGYAEYSTCPCVQGAGEQLPREGEVTE